MNLLHLISQQTVQNLLPLLALQPERVIHVHSKEKQFVEATRRIESAVEVMLQQGLLPHKPEFFACPIDSPNPTIDESRRTVESSLASWPGCVVNLTGGTKPMSIGAFVAAESQREPVIYCDTQRGKILSEGSYGLAKDLPPLPEIARSLTVEVLLAAHGLAPDRLVTEAAPHAELIEFARRADHWKRSAPQDYAAFSAEIRSRYYPGNQSKPIGQTAVDGVLAAGLPAPCSDAAYDFLAAAARAGLVFETAGGKFHYQLDDPTGNSKQRRKALQRITNQLTGGWFEVLVFDDMQRSGKYGDIRRSVQSRDRQTGIGETDLVAIDLGQCSLVFVSCKSSAEIQKPLEHIFALRQRAMQFGGTFAKTILRVHQMTDSGKAKELGNFCQAAGVHLDIFAK